jgi:hypothetical protein
LVSRWQFLSAHRDHTQFDQRAQEMKKVWQWLCGKFGGGHRWDYWYYHGYDVRQCLDCGLKHYRRNKEDYERCWNK